MATAPVRRWSGRVTRQSHALALEPKVSTKRTPRIWVLAADGGRARIFTADTAISGLTELEAFVNPGVRVKQMELKTDRPGQTAASTGKGRRAMAVEVEPKAQERIRFAKMIAERLERARVASAFERLVLVGAPAFLGLVRERMGAALRSQVSLAVNKDYVTLRPRELRSRLPGRI